MNACCAICKVIVFHLGTMFVLTDPDTHHLDVELDDDSAAAIGIKTFREIYVCGPLCKGLGILNEELM